MLRRFLDFGGDCLGWVVLFCFGGLMGLWIWVFGNMLLVWILLLSFFLKSFFGKGLGLLIDLFLVFFIVDCDEFKFWEFLLRRSCNSLVLFLRNCCWEGIEGCDRGGGKGVFNKLFWIGLVFYVLVMLLLLFVVCCKCGGGG